MNCQTHQRVAVSRREVSTFEQLFNRETMKLRRHLSAAAKHARDPHLLQRNFFTQRFEKFGSREQATNIFVRFQESQPLLDDVLLVLLGHLRLAHLQQLDHPTRIEIDHETDPAAMLSQVLDRETQPTWTSWSK